jgi:hypothetical protein
MRRSKQKNESARLGRTAIGIDPRVERMQGGVTDTVLALDERAEVAAGDRVCLPARLRRAGDAV